MNYIVEINNFNNWLLENPMNSAEQALWYKLMAYANQLGWKSEFSMTNSRLCEDLRITRQYLDKCRNTLVNKGLITYKKGNGNQCGLYHLISLSVDTVVDTPVDTVVAHQLTQECLPSLPLNKLNKTKLNKTDKEKVKKEKYGEYQNVLLSEKEYQSLESDFPHTFNELIKFLDEYIEMKGYKAKSHYLAIRKWVVNAVEEHRPKSQEVSQQLPSAEERAKWAERVRQEMEAKKKC